KISFPDARRVPFSTRIGKMSRTKIVLAGWQCRNRGCRGKSTVTFDSPGVHVMRLWSCASAQLRNGVAMSTQKLLAGVSAGLLALTAVMIGGFGFGGSADPAAAMRTVLHR